MDLERERQLTAERLLDIGQRARSQSAGEALGRVADLLLKFSQQDHSGSNLGLSEALLQAISALLLERQNVDDELRARLERLELAMGLPHPPGVPVLGVGSLGHDRSKLVLRVGQLEQWAQHQGSPDHLGTSRPEPLLPPPPEAEITEPEES